jgi:hypothetical protein
MSSHDFIVPWNASWTGEDSYEIRPCRWAGGELALWQAHAPGQGTAVFAKPHLVRQRRSVARFICTVCGEHAPPNDRWWYGLGYFAEGYFMTTEAPIHQACANRALVLCPHLKHLQPTLRRFPDDHGIAASLIGGPKTEKDFRVTIGRRRVIGHLKFVWPEKRFLNSQIKSGVLHVDC